MAENKTLEEALMCRTLGALVKNGVPILESITVTANTFPDFSVGLIKVHDGVREGELIYEAMHKQGEVFSPITQQFVYIGEEVGDLDKTLYRASETLIRKQKMKREDEKDLREITFYRSLAALTESGLPLLRTVRILEEVTSYFPREVLSRLGDEIENGATMSEAMSKQREYFNPFMRSLIAAGETGGILDITLNSIAEYLEFKYDSNP